MYAYLMGDVTDLNEMMRELNNNDCQIISTFYTTDSNQIIIIYDRPQEKPKIGFLRPENE